ncbi:hypothetical protein AVEN_198263-1 [Araneus ventricosus]|uniref:Uncharacterized protein n=1 Tax=Araneus ventricosus TaxID=182803 RepID=A0A4Y2F9N6_ARAVE|nr:hypothetical protein AVEN_198263-1 [Araneus ventricosus]
MGLQGVVVAQGFMGWLEHSGGMSINVWTPKKGSQQTETVQFLTTVAGYVCIEETVRLVEFRLSINPKRFKWIAEKLVMVTRLKEAYRAQSCPKSDRANQRNPYVMGFLGLLRLLLSRLIPTHTPPYCERGSVPLTHYHISVLWPSGWHENPISSSV